MPRHKTPTEAIDYSLRVKPEDYIDALHEGGIGRLRRVRELSRVINGNTQYMMSRVTQAKQMGQRVIGLIGTDERTGRILQREGIAGYAQSLGIHPDYQPRFAAWDVVASRYAIIDAQKLAMRSGEEGHGLISVVALGNPRMDPLGVLAWEADAFSSDVFEVMAEQRLNESLQLLGGTAVTNIELWPSNPSTGNYSSSSPV